MVRENEIYQHFSQEGLKDPRHKETYEFIFRELEKSPDFRLSEDFIGNVISRLEKLERVKRRNFYTLMFGGVFALITGFVAIMVYSFGFESMARFQNITMWGVIIGVMVAIIQFLDQSLIKKRTLAHI